MIIHDNHNDMVVEQLLFGPFLKRAWSQGSYVPGTAAIRVRAMDMDQENLSAANELMADMDRQFLSVYRAATVVAEMAASLITELGSSSSDMDFDDFQGKCDTLLQALEEGGRCQPSYLQVLSSRLRELVKRIRGRGALHADKSEKRWWIQEAHSIADSVAVVLLNLRETCGWLTRRAADKKEATPNKDGNNGDASNVDDSFVEKMAKAVADKMGPPVSPSAPGAGNTGPATHDDILVLKQAIDGLKEVSKTGKKPRRKRQAKDILAFCVRVDELVKPKNGASMQLKDAIKKAWDDNIALPRNASYLTRWRDYERWTTLKQQYGRNPTVAEYEDAMPQIGRPPKMKPLTQDVGR